MYKEYYCNICNKIYKSNSSLWNHNKKFHGIQNDNIDQNMFNKSLINNDTICKYCNFNFTKRNNLNKHYRLNRCKIKNKIEKDKILEEENIILKNKIIDLEKDKYKLKELETKLVNLEKSIDNSVMSNNNTTNNNNATLNNYQQNNNALIQLGKEQIVQVLPKSEQLKILNTCYNSLYRLIKEIHCNDKYPQFQNIVITNLKDNYALKYDEKSKNFIKCHKNELVEALIDNRIFDIEDLLNANIDDITEDKIMKLKILIEEINEKKGCYKDKKEQIKLLLYNNNKLNNNKLNNK